MDEPVLAPVGESELAVMRADPPASTLMWLTEALDCSAVVAVDVMRGGSTAAMHRVTLRDSAGTESVVVLRRYVLGRVLDEEPDIASHEIAALELAAASPVPTPALLAADPDATVADAATIVMSWLDGRPRWDGSPRQRWLDQIVDTIVELHQIEVSSPPGRIPGIARYAQSSYEPPRWSQRPQVWEQAFEIFHGPIPDSEDCFIHRDFHPGNLLWRRRQLTGVVDWQTACVGPSSVDPGHCRLNMFYDDPALADQLRITWEQRSGHRYHPWADINAIVGVLDHIRTPKKPNPARAAIEDALAKAVTDLSN